MSVQSLVPKEVEVLAQHAHFDGPKFLGNQVLHRLKRGLMPLPKMVLDELKSVYPCLMHGSNIMQYFIALVHYLWRVIVAKFEV